MSNLPHALATLTRDVLQRWAPTWWAEAYGFGRYEVERGHLYGLDRPMPEPVTWERISKFQRLIELGLERVRQWRRR